ncbi:LamB/YcsF family protein [Nocardioides sp.]|uniref:LamB/YcsF family protein n=1 Tax=Nocardioides sp. TaxID=35761 RepID=UPI00263102B7|nr:LamB/YcsF family protein [Nocardioides sp.]
MLTVDLNADLGEEITDDAGLMAVVTSANVACGYHAGSVAVMRAVCDLAAAGGVAVGAQVSYADRENFGRVELDVDAAVLTEQIADQVGLLREAATAAGIEVTYLKAHGALYHRTRRDAVQAAAVLAGAAGLPVLGMPGELLTQARAEGRRTIAEGFPDRAYDGEQLRPRDQPGALVSAEPQIIANAVRLATSGVESLCLHGDSPGAVEHARAVRAALEAEGWALRSFR